MAKRSQVLHLYCAFSTWICSKEHYKYQFTPSGPKAHIGASGSRFNAVHVMLVLILPTSEGWKAEWTSTGKKVTGRVQPPTRPRIEPEAEDWTWDLQRFYHCANPSANCMATAMATAVVSRCFVGACYHVGYINFLIFWLKFYRQAVASKCFIGMCCCNTFLPHS